MSFPMSEQCANCYQTIFSPKRYGCCPCAERLSGFLKGPYKTYCSPNCVAEHRLNIHGMTQEDIDKECAEYESTATQTN